MYTICETPLFTKYCLVYWTQEEYEEFKTFLALNPEAGDVEPNSGGIRKIRWTSGGRGKSGGVRVIYFNRLTNGEICSFPTRWRNFCPARKVTTRRAEIGISSPVFGLRPGR